MKRNSEIEIASDMLLLVVHIHKYKNISLNAELDNYKTLSNAERKCIKQIVYQTVRNIIFIDYIINKYTDINSLKESPFVLNLIRVFISQVIFRNDVDEKTIFKNVMNICKDRCDKTNIKFVNGILKEFLSSSDELVLPDKTDEINYLSVVYSYPIWIVKYWLIAHGFENVEKICMENNKDIKIYACLNTMILNKTLIFKSLNKDELIFNRDDENGSLIFLDRPKMYMNSYTYKNGLLFFIDKSATKIIDILAPEKNSNLLIMTYNNTSLSLYASLYMENSGNIDCISQSDHQVLKLSREKRRLKFNNINEKVEDFLIYNQQYQGKYDFVALDAQSSELGLIKRNPFRKFTYQYQDIKTFVNMQRSMLENASRYVSDNGKILYTNATISQHENIENVNWFVENFDFEIIEMHQLLPGVDNVDSDGVFIALFRKKS